MQEALSASETMFAPNAGFVTLVSKIYSAEEYDIIKEIIRSRLGIVYFLKFNCSSSVSLVDRLNFWNDLQKIVFGHFLFLLKYSVLGNRFGGCFDPNSARSSLLFGNTLS